MTDQISLAFLVFFGILRWIVILDVILSWTVLFGISVKIPFVRAILDPAYLRIRRALPTGFSGLDFAPLVLLLGLYALERLTVFFNPSVVAYF